MAIKTLKGLRKQQARQELSDQGYTVIAHRQNYIKTDRMLQIAINRIAKLIDETPELIYHRIKGELHYLESNTRVRQEKDKSRVIDDRVVCLKHIDPASPLNTIPKPISDK